MDKSDAPKRQDSATHHNNNPQNRGPAGNAPPRVGGEPPSPREHNNTNEDSNQSPWWGLKTWQFVGEIILIIVGIRVAYIYSGQLNQMVESNKINRDALESVQRAFVFLGPNSRADFFKMRGAIVFFTVTFEWENSGTTPTSGMTHGINWVAQDSPLPSDFAFSDEGTPLQAVLGPHSSIGSTARPVAATMIPLIQSWPHQKHLYFWGWAKYGDVFPKTPEHLTEFCLEAIRFADLDRDSTKITFTTCPTHNCFDEQWRMPHI